MAQMPPSSGSSLPPDLGGPIEAPGWPKGLGIFSIVWGSLGIICNGCASLNAFIGPAFYEWGRQQQIKAGGQDMGPFPDVYKATPIEMIASIISIIGVVVLLIAGVALLRRTLSGRSLHIVYAIISILGTALWAIAAIMKVGDINAWVAANPGHPFLKQPGATMGTNPLFAIGASVIALIYPVFILIWFLAIKSRPEQLGVSAEEPLV